MIHKIGGESFSVLIMLLLSLPQEECARGPMILVWRSRALRTCNVWDTRPAGDHSSASVLQGSSESAQVQSVMDRAGLDLLLLEPVPCVNDSAQKTRACAYNIYLQKGSRPMFTLMFTWDMSQPVHAMRHEDRAHCVKGRSWVHSHVAWLIFTSFSSK